jgi:hypothetical protein
MKRMIVAAALLLSTVSVFAADVKSEGRNVQKKKEVKMSNLDASECSLSLTATFGPSWGQVTVTCKGTATTCKEAVHIANNCLEEAKKAILQ